MRATFLMWNIGGDGGAENITIQLANTLSDNGIEVAIYSVCDGVVPHFALDGRVTVKSLGCDKKGEAWTTYLRAALMLRKELNSNKLCRKKEPPAPLVIVGTPIAGFAYIATWMRGVRRIVWDHSAFTYNRPLWRVVSCWTASRLLVLTGSDRDAYRKKYPLRRATIEVMYNFFDRAKTQAQHTDFSHKKVISVGRLSREKGVDRLLDVWEEVQEQLPDWSLDIVGDGVDMPMLQQRAKTLQRVKFLGRRRDVAELLARSSIFAMTSRTEGLPLVLLEAQNAGLPCIAYDCPSGPREVLTPATGILVEDDNTQEFARQLVRLATVPGELQRLSKGTTSNLERFDKEKITRRWIEILAR